MIQLAGIMMVQIMSTWYQHAVYTGPSERLGGETALITDDPNDHDMVLAQFDRQPLYIGKDNLSSGWHQFYRAHFTVDTNAPLRPLRKDRSRVVDRWTDDQLESKGLWKSGDKIMATCCCCDQSVEFVPDPADWSESDEYYCGGSPRCCP